MFRVVGHGSIAFFFAGLSFFDAFDFEQSRFHTGRTSNWSVHPRNGEEDAFARGFLSRSRRFCSARAQRGAADDGSGKSGYGQRANTEMQFFHESLQKEFRFVFLTSDALSVH